MVERMKDEHDRALEALFASDPIADDGFSQRLMRRIRRRLWIQRLALPTAFVLGLAIAARPAYELAGALSGLATLLPVDALSPLKSLAEASSILPNMSAVAALGMAAVAAMVLLPALED